MSNLPALGVALKHTIAASVPQIQHAFLEYQQHHFIQRRQEFFCLELCGEAGELANLVKKQWKGASVSSPDIADEAADVFIALMNFCNAAGIDLAAAVEQKLERIPTNREHI
jgi:NTP pyrophosphatase (non-canonical NTP hydrolase)